MASVVLPPPCNSPSPPPSTSSQRERKQRFPSLQTNPMDEKSDESNPSVRARLSQLCKDGRLEAAHQLFDSIRKPNTVQWNTMIVGFICNGFPDEALRFYRRMRENSGRKPDVYTYSSALKACSDLRDLRAGRAIHCHVLRSRLKPSRILCNSLLNMYTNCLSLSFAYHPVDEFPQRSPKFTGNGNVGGDQIISEMIGEEGFGLQGDGIDSNSAASEPIHQSFHEITHREGSDADDDAETNCGRDEEWIYNRTAERLERKMRENMVSPSFSEPPRTELSMFSPKLNRLRVVHLLFDRIKRRNAVTWNIMISWYCRIGQPLKAVEYFRLMLESGIKGTVLSFVNVFPALGQLGDWQGSHAFHGLLLKSGPSYAYDPYAVSSLICLYFGFSDLDSSRKVFDSVPERNTEIWNSMISGYIQNDHPDAALNLFLQLLDSDQRPDAVTMLCAVMAVSQLQQSEFCSEIHAYALKTLVDVPLMVSNALLAMYSRCDNLGTAYDFFSKMSEKDLVSWNTMISAYLQNDLNMEALKLVQEMRNQSFLFDPVTITLILSASSNMGYSRIGKQSHGYIFRHGIYFEGVESYLVDMYMKSGCIETARKVFESVRFKDQVLWNTMIAGFTQNGLSSEAFKAFQDMLEEQQPNSVTIASILPACNTTAATICRGKEFHAFAIRHALDNNVFVNTALVDMYIKCGTVASAVKVFERMLERNSVSYTTMIAGYGVHSQGHKALEIFKEMLEAGLKPDSITFLAVLSACSHSGLVEEGLRIFYSMSQDYDIDAPVEHCCCFVDMLGKARMIEEAYEFVREVNEKFNSAKLWGTLLNVCRMHGRLKLGKLVADRLLETENGIAGYHVLLSHIYAAEGRWDNVDNVRKLMREKGLRKEVGKSWIEVYGVTHFFTARDQSHQHSEGIYATLDNLLLNMKGHGYKPMVNCLDDLLTLENG